MNESNEYTKGALYPLFEKIEEITGHTLLDSELLAIQAVAVKLWLEEKIEEITERQQKLIEKEGILSIAEQIAMRNMQHRLRILTDMMPIT